VFPKAQRYVDTPCSIYRERLNFKPGDGEVLETQFGKAYLRQLLKILNKLISYLHFYGCTLVSGTAQTVTIYLFGARANGVGVGGYELLECGPASDIYEDGVRVTRFFLRAVPKTNPYIVPPRLKHFGMTRRFESTCHSSYPRTTNL
jgi:hypothetical protein